MKLELSKEQLELLEFIIEDFEYQDTEILNEWEDLLDVHTVLENIKVKYEEKLAKAQAKQPTMEWN